MKRGVVAKMMEAWEAKATKRAANATGFTLLAVSLAACNDDAAVAVEDEEEVVEEEVVEEEEVVTVTPVALELTTDNDILTSADFTTAADTITADQDTYEDADVIVEGTSGDGDTLTISTDADITATPTVVGIENIVVNASLFGAAGAGIDFAADGIANGTITLNHVQAGSTVDTATVTGAAGVTIVAGTDVDTLDVTMIEDGGTVVDAGEATTVNVTSTDGDDQVATFVANGDVALDVDSAAGTLTDVNVTATVASDVTFTDTGTDVDTITGDANTTFVGADLSVFAGLTVTGAAAVEGGGAATADLTGVAVAITVDDGVASALTVADGASVVLSTTLAVNTTTFNFIAEDDDDTTTDVEQSLTVTLSDDTTAASTLLGGYSVTLSASADDGSNEITTLNLVATGDLSGAAATGDVGVDLGTNALDTTVVISGAGDIDVLFDTATTTGDITINAAALAGALTMAAENEMVSIIGGDGADTIDVSNLTAAETITLAGGAGNDTIDGGNDLTGATITGFEIFSAHNYELLASQLHNATYVVSDGATLDLDVAATSIDITTIDLSGLTFADATDDVTVNLTAIDTSVLTSGLGFTYTGSDAEDIVTGSANADTISGGAGIDTLAGGAGADTINGGAGADTITGGTGADTLTGGAGADTFVFDAIILAANANTITDFEADDDILQFDNGTYSVSVAGTAAIETVASVGVAASLDLDDIIVDTAANIIAADLSTEYTAGTAAGFAIAIASDTGAIYIDADGDFTDGAIIIGSLTAGEVDHLAAGNFSFIA